MNQVNNPNSNSDINQILWTPSKEQIERANSTKFITTLNSKFDIKLSSFQQLHTWSVNNPESFWEELWYFVDVIGDKGKQILENENKMPGAVWFSDSKINFAENLLNDKNRMLDDEAIVFWGEDQQKRTLNYSDLKEQVASLSAYLRDENIKPGDVVAGFMPNMPEAVIGMLATTSIGAVWTSCSPDFGVQGVLDRFGQVKPKLLITANAYFYNGKTHDCLGKIKTISASIDSIKNVVVVPYASESKLDDSTYYPQILSDYSQQNRKEAEIEYTRMPFNSPLYIMYSSGTTGVPKCIVHGVGGTLLQHLKEHILHADVKREDRVFYFTTCGWMMWNWLVSCLQTGATLMLYDGSPFYPDANIMLNYAEEENISVFGTSAKYIDGLRKESLDFTQTHSLDNLKSILSTGSVLVPESFDYVYKNIKKDVCLSSISGGTDIVSCFALGSSTLPVIRGELQTKGLGMAVEIWDDYAKGEADINTKGELVCSKPFPSMPIYFWNDPDNKKYHDAYFAKYENIWCHGDYVSETETGGLIFYGRSDTVLNPGGVRIGTAEIYRQVEKLDEVKESIVVGQEWQDDVRVVLFVKLSEGLQLNDDLIKKIKLQIRSNTTPRHVPAKVLQVNDIPRTKSGKIVEIAVRCCIHNEVIKNSESLANPEALNEYRDRSELLS
ncbi:MAG: acetoacetyl-CoA synthetase [Cocleimonas sp.]|jgi:acetoacetyl-CoA synthetase